MISNMKNQKIRFKILLATDGSAHSKVVLKKVSNRPYAPKTEVRIVSVYESTPMITTLEPRGVSQEYYAASDKYALKTAEKITKNAADILRKKHPALTISTAVIDGSPKKGILEEAEKYHADLIIVGSHGSDAMERFLLGSVSQAVALHAKCSVEIVRK